MAFHVTQCPGCDSTFNTNARLLQSAAGMVRCGACLTVFEAAENFIAINDADEDEDASVFVGNDPADYFNPSQFITRSALTAPEPLPETSLTATDETADDIAPGAASLFAEPAVLPDPAQHFAESDPATDSETDEIDFLSAVAAELDTASTETPLYTEPAQSAEADITVAAADQAEFIEPPSPPEATLTPTAETAQPEAPQHEPESIRLHASFSFYRSPLPEPRTAVAMPESGTDPDAPLATEAPGSPDADNVDLATTDADPSDSDTVYLEIIDTDLATADAPHPEPIATSDPEPGAVFTEATDDFELIDLDRFEYVDTAGEAAVETMTDMPLPPEQESDPVAVVAEDSTESIRARAFRANLRDDDALEALPQESRAAIGKVLPPVELLSGRERQWGRRLALALACLLLAAALAAQFLWQRLPVYSRTAEWRPLYEFACRQLACALPTYSEISAIRSDNLVVRSHPTVANALSVSLSFRNTADFPQPFPVVILSFNSATNAIIALREFAPAEYLASGLREMTLMPVMSPVQIELEVMDPGADAVNYTVAFRRP